MTPTEDLIMEVLAARARLGETMWPFSTKLGKALKSLEDRGYIDTMHGMVEYSVRASLTDKGVEEYLDDRYLSPLERDVLKLKKKKGKKK